VSRGRDRGKRALMLALLLRLIYSVFAAVAAVTQTVNWRLVQSNGLTENLPPPDHSWRYLLLGVWNRFDTLWYLHVAAHGYDRPDAVVFFPLYPSLIKVVSLLVPPVAAALLISTLAAFFLFWGLQELLMGDHSPGFAAQSVWLCGCWPAGFVFFAGYPESLFRGADYLVVVDGGQRSLANGGRIGAGRGVEQSGGSGSGGAAAHDGLPDEEDEVIGGCVDPSRRGGVSGIFALDRSRRADNGVCAILADRDGAAMDNAGDEFAGVGSGT